MTVRILLSRSIGRSLDPPLDHAAIVRRLGRVASPLASRGRRATLSLSLVSDDRIRGINREWLGRDRPTNVIAFPSPDMAAHARRSGPVRPAAGILDATAGPGPLHLGDVVVSVDTALREAGPSGRDDRIAYLAIHGLLHLLGWDHDDAPSWRRMDRATRSLLAGAP